MVLLEEYLRRGGDPKSLLDFVDPIQTRVVGGYYNPTGRAAQKELEEGEEVFLKPDKHNEVDPFAIAVYSEDNVMLGYLKKELAAAIDSLRGIKAHVYDTIPSDEEQRSGARTSNRMIGVGIELTSFIIKAS